MQAITKGTPTAGENCHVSKLSDVPVHEFVMITFFCVLKIFIKHFEKKKNFKNFPKLTN